MDHVHFYIPLFSLFMIPVSLKSELLMADYNVDKSILLFEYSLLITDDYCRLKKS